MGTELDQGYSRYTKTRRLEMCEGAPNHRLVDIGMGNGELWEYAATSWKQFGIDLSPVGVRIAVASHSTLSASVAIAEGIPFPSNYFGSAIAADTLEHVMEIDQALCEIGRILAPGGKFALSVPAPDSLRNWAFNSFLRTRPSPLMLVRLIWVLIRRKWLFGSTTFQPIDRDLRLNEWLRILQAANFKITEVEEWPIAPKAPIVYLIETQNTDG